MDYQKQIDDGIEKANNILYVISPHSVNSAYCGLEVELALKHRKRIIPLLHVEEISYETWQQRNPEGTAEEWEDYKAAGKHSHFTLRTYAKHIEKSDVNNRWPLLYLVRSTV